MNITDSFIRGIKGICCTEISNQVVVKARLCFLDYLACAVGGSKGLQDSAMRSFLIDEAGQGNNHVIGWEGAFPVASAALINGFSAHFLELDDGHRKGAIHIGAPVFSTLLAVAENEEISSEDFVKGVIAGYEASARLSCAVQPGCRERGYHSTGVCGTVGAAIGAAMALHLSDKQVKTVISAAVAGAAGVLEMQEDASELKPYNAGRAAMDAVIAVYMGKAGFQGPEDPIGGSRGFLKVMTDAPKTDYLCDFTSDSLQIEQTYMKLYAACRHAHPAIEAALSLRERIEADEVTGIRVLTYKQATEGHSHKDIPSVSSAKMSIPFSVAASFVTGEAGLDAFTEDSIHDKAIINLMQKVSIEPDEALTALNPMKRASIVEVSTSQGTFTQRVDYPKGEPENPLSSDEVKNKFMMLAELAGVKKEDSETVINEVWKDNFSIKRILSVLSK